MHQCEICGAVGSDWSEITEEEVYQMAQEGVIDHPDDLEDALANLGMQCGECGSMSTIPFAE